MVDTDKVWMYEEIMTNDDNLESHLGCSGCNEWRNLEHIGLCVAASGSKHSSHQHSKLPTSRIAPFLCNRVHV